MYSIERKTPQEKNVIFSFDNKKDSMEKIRHEANKARLLYPAGFYSYVLYKDGEEIHRIEVFSVGSFRKPF